MKTLMTKKTPLVTGLTALAWRREKRVNCPVEIGDELTILIKSKTTERLR